MVLSKLNWDMIYLCECPCLMRAYLGIYGGESRTYSTLYRNCAEPNFHCSCFIIRFLPCAVELLRKSKPLAATVFLLDWDIYSGCGGTMPLRCNCQSPQNRFGAISLRSGVIHFFYWVCLSRAYTSGEISYVYPIARSAPGFLPFFAFLFLDERLSAQGLVGIFLILFSIYLLQLRGGGLTFKDLLVYIRRPASVWALLTLGTVIAYSLIDKAGMSEFYAHSAQRHAWQPVSYFLTESIIAMVLYGSYIMLWFPSRGITDIGHQEWKKVLATGVLSMLSYTIILYVYMTESVSYVVALRQCSVIFAVLLGGYLLKESQTKLRFMAAVVMVIGMFLIATA